MSVTCFFHNFTTVLLVGSVGAFDLFPANSEIVYRLEADVTLVPDLSAKSNYVWTMVGQLHVQRYDASNLAVKVG